MDNIYCDECKEVIEDGYMIHDGIEHYCSDECLYKKISEEDYQELYDQGYAFWTTFEN